MLKIRISDTVLDRDEWPTANLVFSDGGKVVAAQQLSLGVYGVEHIPAAGASITEVCKWLAYDGTGKHPEIFHEAFFEEEWRSFLSPQQLQQWIEARLS